MAKEIQATWPTTGATLYALVYNSVGQVWQTTTSTFVTYVTANLANYTITMTEQGTAGRKWTGDFPAATAGVYPVIAYVRAGGSAAEGDYVAGSGDINWNGTVVVSLAVGVPTAVWQDATAGDFTVASSIGKSLYTGNFAPGASGGLLISGANAGTTTFAALTCTGTFTISDGIVVTCSTNNKDALKLTGTGTGYGIYANGGAGSLTYGMRCDGQRAGIGAVALSSSGAASGIICQGPIGMFLNGTGTTAGVNGMGLMVWSYYDGIDIVAGVNGGTDGSAIKLTGIGAGDGLTCVGGGTGVDIRGNIVGNVTGTLTTVTTAVNLTNAPTAGDFTAAMKTSLNAATPSVTITDKTGFKLAADGLALVTTWTVAITGNITGSLSGSVGSVSGAVGSVTGNVGGSVASVTADVGITQAGADKAWSTAARTLTAGTNIVLAKGVGLTGLNDIAATAVVSAGAITTLGGKVSGVILADTVTIYTGNTPQTGDSFARIGVAGAGLTALGDTRIANLDAAVSTRTKPADTQAAVTLVTTTTNLTNLPAVPTDWLTGAGVKADAVTKIQAGLATPTNITAGTMTTVTNLTNAPTAGDFTAAMKTSLNASTPAVTVSDKTGFSLTSAYDDAKTAAQAGDAMGLTAGTGNALVAATAAAVTSDHGAGSYIRNTEPPTTAEISTQVWTEQVPGAFLPGSAAVALNSAGSAGDPWGTMLPGAYGAGTAGMIVGTYLDAAISEVHAQVTADHGSGSYVTASGFAVPGSQMALIDNAISDAKITVPSDGTGQASGMLSKLLWLYQRFFGKVVYTKGAGSNIKTYQGDGATIRTTQATSSTSAADEVGAAT